MNITVSRVNNQVHFLARNQHGNEVHIDGDEGSGGEDAGFRPMQLLLAAVAGCSSVDVVSILEKQKQRLQDIRISVSGDRRDSTPAPFEAIHLHYELVGELDEQKASRAVDLAVDKYCSVAATFGDNVKISHSFEIREE